jgi:hypothetical protein
MEGSMYRTLSFLAILIAVFAVGFWCVKFYKILEEGGLKLAANEIIYPLILVVMLSNNASNLSSLTLATRDVINSFNVRLNRVIDTE